MEKSFSFEQTVVNGKEYIHMKSDVFHSFFLELVKYSDVDDLIVNEVNKRYNHAKKIKKKRIRLKKEKEILVVMYNILIDKFIK